MRTSQASIYNLPEHAHGSLGQGRRELFEAQGQTENRGPLRAKRAEDFSIAPFRLA